MWCVDDWKKLQLNRLRTSWLSLARHFRASNDKHASMFAFYGHACHGLLDIDRRRYYPWCLVVYAGLDEL